MTELKCIICKGDIEKHYSADGIMYWDQGHNAEPIADGRCCDKCNDTQVIPMCIADMYVHKEDNNE